MFTSSKQRRKRKFTVVFVQVVKKSALDVQSLSFFIYLLGSFSSSSPPPSSLPPGFTVGIRTQHSFSKSACHLFTSYVCYSKFGPLMNCFVSLETDIWVERKKQSVVLEKNYCKETTRAEWIKANCALKILIFRYFTFFLELIFYFVLFIHFISFLRTTFSGTHVRTVRTCRYAPGAWFGFC